jgi:hypothetical protein
VLQCSINIAKDQLEANKILPTLIRELGRKSERYQHGDYMKSKIFFIAMVVVVATMPLGLATVGRPHTSRETAPSSAASWFNRCRRHAWQLLLYRREKRARPA